MNELTEEQKEKALKKFIYCQEYYKNLNKIKPRKVRRI